MALQVGDHAPNFTLFSSDKQPVSLSDYSGRPLLILFFPQAFTGVCTTELCNVRDHMVEFNSLNTQVLGISVDSVFTLAKYKEEQQLNFVLLSDFNKKVSTAYGSLYNNFVFDMHGVSKRSAFIVDADGKIVYAEVLENAGDIPDFSAINQKLKSLAGILV